MGARLTPISSTKLGSASQVTVLLGNGGSTSQDMPDTVISKNIFGKSPELAKGEVTYEQFSRGGYISLPIPVLNPFLAGSNNTAWAAVLGRKSEEIEDISKGLIFFDQKDNVEVRSKESSKSRLLSEKYMSLTPFSATYPNRFIIGGDYIAKLLKETENSVDDIIEQVCFDIMEAYFSDFDKVELKRGIDCFICKDKGVHIFDEYHFYTEDTYLLSMLQEQETLDKMRVAIHEKLPRMTASLNKISRSGKRLVYLVALKRNPQGYSGQILESCYVIPLGFRPNIDSRKDDLTIHYNTLLGLTKRLSKQVQSCSYTLGEVRQAYLDVLLAVNAIMLKRGTFDKEQYKPILETFKKKKGLIRNSMEGARVDYSGRTVIVADPEMSMDTVGLPMSIAIKLAELDMYEYSASAGSGAVAKLWNRHYDKSKEKLAATLLNNKVIMIGRQPSLYTLSIQGFKVKVVDGNALKLSPLITPSFNADFDGDTMHGEKATDEKSQREMDELLYVKNNLFLIKDGECHIAPRHEILYGLWYAASILPKSDNVYTWLTYDVASRENLEKVLAHFELSQVDIDTPVMIEGHVYSVGNALVHYCLSQKYFNVPIGGNVFKPDMPYSSDVRPVKKSVASPGQDKWFKAFLKWIAENDRDMYIQIVDAFVKVGFAVAKKFPPNLGVLASPDISKLLKEFDKRVSAREELFNLGFETETAYNNYYNNEYALLQRAVTDDIKRSFTSDNGYVKLSDSKARGSDSNIYQLFGLKGRIMKNKMESFNAIIKHSLSDGLTGIEHFITAYGAREGIAEKILETSKPGYLERQLTHTSGELVIRSKDCGTTSGLCITYSDLAIFSPDYTDNTSLSEEGQAKESLVYNFVHDYFTSIVIGRYIVGYADMVRTKADAERIFLERIAIMDKGTRRVKILDGIMLRSPLFCEDPCCQKCYGIDLATNKLAKVGLAVGFLAAQAATEPCTQLTMKNFQRGGVASGKNLTNAFDLLDDYIHAYGLKENKVCSYDVLSPVTGTVVPAYNGDGTKTLIFLNNSGSPIKGYSVVVPETTVTVSVAERGMSLVKDSSSYMSIDEVGYYHGIEAERRYLALKLYDLFKEQIFVNFKYFEVIVAGMSLYLCLKGNDYFKSGCYYTQVQYFKHDRAGADFTLTVHGARDVSARKSNFFDTIFLEDIRDNAARSIVLNGSDDLDNPLTRLIFGIPTNTGSDIPGFI